MPGGGYRTHRLRSTSLRLWHLIPQFARLYIYRILRFVGEYIYGKGTYGVVLVQRLPFNLYLKQAGGSRVQNEARALELVAKHTTLNAPRVVDLIDYPSRKETWMVTTRLEGNIAGKCLESMNADQLERFGIDFRQYVEQIRLIPNPYPNLIYSALGGECRDCRINHDNGNAGPYNRTEYLNTHLMDLCSPIRDSTDRAIIEDVHSRPYRVFFAHADANPGNVLVNNGRLSGFVDWEFAGWYPEYWEPTKACYTVFQWRVWLDLIAKTFPEYLDELTAERILRDHTCPF